MEKIKVGILGSTGSVGQKFIQLLTSHPYFEITALTASEKSVGIAYGERVNWIQDTILDKKIANIKIQNSIPNIDCQVVFSGLDSSVAGEIETDFASKGYHVISNSKNHRWDENVPLLIPEVNHEHLGLINHQQSLGKIVTNPNCSTIGLVMALKPLNDRFGISEFNVVTMQALSGAGYPGVSSLKIIDNVIPFIDGEEEKIEKEPLKILSKYDGNKLIFPHINISAQCNRVNVIDGHIELIQIRLIDKVKESEVIDAWDTFRSIPQELRLPMAPQKPLYYFDSEELPQPRILRNIDKGMAVSIGRLRKCNIFDYKFVILSHNTIRGAAGGAILSAELMYEKGLFN